MIFNIEDIIFNVYQFTDNELQSVIYLSHINRMTYRYKFKVKISKRYYNPIVYTYYIQKFNISKLICNDNITDYNLKNIQNFVINIH